MKSKWLIVLSSTLLLLITFSLVSGTALTDVSTNLDLTAVENYLESQMQRHRLKGLAVTITQGEEIVYLKGYGSASSGQSITPQTPFYIGSVSKSFTALAVMQLVDQGLIDLDLPVETYLPWFVTADSTLSSHITIRHLLNQTSGLSNASLRRPEITEETTLEESVRHLRQAELIAPPGTTFQYFNPNYNVIAQVVEEVTGQNFEAYLVDHIFNPLGMARSFVELEPAQNAGLADGHITFLGFPISRQQRFLPAELPAGFVISTAEDMGHYMIAQLNKGAYHQTEIISPESITAMHTPPEDIQSDYAMGWVAQEQDGITKIRHNGAVDTFYADVILLPDHDIGVTLLINHNALIPLAMAYGPLADGLVDTLLGRESASGPSLRMIYGVLIAIIILDFFRHYVVFSRLSKWKERVYGKSKLRLVFVVVLQHLLFPAVLFFIIIMMITTTGINAARTTLFYFIPDIALWLLISALLSVTQASLKLRWIFKQPVKRAN